MITKEMISRINELARKKRSEGLSPEETAEQKEEEENGTGHNQCVEDELPVQGKDFVFQHRFSCGLSQIQKPGGQ